MKTKISIYQTTLLLVITVLGTAILLAPTFIISEAKQDAWLVGILLVVFAGVISLIYVFLIRRMGKMDLIKFSRQVFGKTLTIPLGIGLFIYFLIISGTVIRETSEIMVGVYLPATPLWFFNLISILTVAVLVCYGLEVMARSLEIVFYFFLVTFLVAVFALIKDMSIGYLQPVLGTDLQSILGGTYLGLIFFSQLFIILILAPQLGKQKQCYQALFRAIIIIGVVFLIAILTSIMIFGPQLAANLTFPLLSAHRYGEVFTVVERLDPLFIFYWMGGGTFKAAIFLYSAVYVGQKFFKLDTYYCLIPIAIPITFYISFYYFQNFAELVNFIQQSTPYFLSIQVLYPCLLLVVSSLRGIKAK